MNINLSQESFLVENNFQDIRPFSNFKKSIKKFVLLDLKFNLSKFNLADLFLLVSISR